MVYVSITGLQLKRFWFYPKFAWHAVRAMTQARAAPGNLRAEARTINGVHHTLTVWRDEDAMRAFLYSGAHAEAIASFKRIATGRTFGFEAEEAPAWDSVPGLWRDKGRVYA